MPATTNSFTWKQVAEHNHEKSSWVSINGKVYDVTSWIDKHPGGRDMILLSAGRDITQLFVSYHQRIDYAESVLKKFEIGTLLDNELPVFPERSKFFRVAKERIQEYFKKTNQNPKFHPMMLVRYAVVFMSVVFSYYLQFYYKPISSSWVLSLPFALVLGFFCAQVGLLPLHDASHCAITKNPWVWRILGASHDFINGASYLNWCYQHLLGHHPYTNIENADPDITTNDPDIRRIKPKQKWYEHYVNQHLFIPFLYGALAAKVRIQDVNILFVLGINDSIRVNPIKGWHLFTFWFGKAFFFLYRVILPVYLGQNSWVKVLSMLLVSDLVSSYWLALTFQANHVVDDVEWPVPDDKNVVHQDWATIQVVTAQDYAHKSWFWTNFAGSLNYQIVHHLFPNILQHYYPEIAPIIIETCKEFGIRYRVKDTYLEAISGHLKHLEFLGKEDLDFSLMQKPQQENSGAFILSDRPVNHAYFQKLENKDIEQISPLVKQKMLDLGISILESEKFNSTKIMVRDNQSYMTDSGYDTWIMEKIERKNIVSTSGFQADPMKPYNTLGEPELNHMNLLMKTVGLPTDALEKIPLTEVKKEASSKSSVPDPNILKPQKTSVIKTQIKKKETIKEGFDLIREQLNLSSRRLAAIKGGACFLDVTETPKGTALEKKDNSQSNVKQSKDFERSKTADMNKIPMKSPETQNFPLFEQPDDNLKMPPSYYLGKRIEIRKLEFMKAKMKLSEDLQSQFKAEELDRRRNYLLKKAALDRILYRPDTIKDSLRVGNTNLPRQNLEILRKLSHEEKDLEHLKRYEEIVKLIKGENGTKQNHKGKRRKNIAGDYEALILLRLKKYLQFNNISFILKGMKLGKAEFDQLLQVIPMNDYYSENIQRVIRILRKEVFTLTEQEFSDSTSRFKFSNNNQRRSSKMPQTPKSQ